MIIMKQLTLNQFITKARVIHNKKYDYSHVHYINSRTKISILCSKHGFFDQTPNKHLSGNGCKRCGHNQISIKIKDTVNFFLKKAIKKHGKKYDYSNINYINSTTKITIKCFKHGIFKQVPSKHLIGHNCPKCAIETRAKKNVIWTKEICLKIARKFQFRNEWEKNHRKSYRAAANNNWLDECSLHMKRLGSSYKRLIYAFEFPDKSVYVGLTFNSEKRKNQHLNNRASQVYKHQKLTQTKPQYLELTEYIKKCLAVKKENEYLNDYKKKGWVILNKAKTGALGGSKIKWTFDISLIDASKYESLTEWRKYSNSAYVTACRNKWIKKCKEYFNTKTT
jgi:predicted GIY-YIG superfamily endonuclease